MSDVGTSPVSAVMLKISAMSVSTNIIYKSNVHVMSHIMNRLTMSPARPRLDPNYTTYSTTSVHWCHQICHLLYQSLYHTIISSILQTNSQVNLSKRSFLTCMDQSVDLSRQRVGLNYLRRGNFQTWLALTTMYAHRSYLSLLLLVITNTARNEADRFNWMNIAGCSKAMWQSRDRVRIVM